MKKRILMIDDEVALTSMVKMDLEETGDYEVYIENDSRKAIAAVKHIQPDLVLLDVMMPHIDGNEIAQRLKDNIETRNIKYLFLSSIVTRADTRENGHIIGGNYFLSKPVKIDVLKEAIWAVIH